MILTAFVLLLTNPIIAIILLITFVVLKKYIINKRKIINKQFDNKSNKSITLSRLEIKDSKEILYNINLKVGVIGCVAISSSSIGQLTCSGAIIFKNIKDEAILKELLSNIPTDFTFTIIKSERYGNVYLLSPKISISVYGKEKGISIISGITNSLATSIPANEVKVLSGKQLITTLLNASLGGLKICQL